MENKWNPPFFTGINYWALKNATRMWEDYDAEGVEKDLRNLKDAGITHLRIFPMWHVFQPLKALYTTRDVPYEYTFRDGPLPDTEAGRAGVSEEACQKFEHFCDTAEKYDLKLIVGLITGHMSFGEFAPEAFAGLHRLSNPTVLKWQLKYVRYFVRRFRNRPCILGWDLGNEVNNMAHGKDFNADDFYVWCSAISDAVRACDPDRPVISGMDTISLTRTPDNLEVIRDTCDVHTCHPYNIFQTASDPLVCMKPILDLAFRCRLSEDITGVPTFVQEFGAIGYMNCSPKTEASFYRACLYTALTHGCHGVMWWCAFDQGHLRFPPYNWNNIGSDYGFFDKDRQPKPIVEENRKFRDLLSKLPYGEPALPERPCVILVPRDNGDMNRDTLLASYLLCKRAGLEARFADALGPVPDAKLYILPSASTNQTLPANRLDEILEKVRKGATFYFSVGNSLFRRVPELTGIQIAWREVIELNRVVQLDNQLLPIHSPVHYHLESCDAQVIANDDEGTPSLVRRKYGEGWIYFMLQPLEQEAATRPGAFFDPSAPEYETVYRKLAECANIRRKVQVSSRYVIATEHAINDDLAYIFLINYSPYPIHCPVKAETGTLTELDGTPVPVSPLPVNGCDVRIFLWKRS